MAKLTKEQEKMVYQQIINLIRQKLNDNQTLKNKISDGIWEKLGYKPYNKQTLDKLGQNESSDDEYKDNFNQIFQSALCENKNDKLQLREGVKVQIKQILTSIYNGQMFKQSNGSFESPFKDDEVDKAVDKLLNNSDFVTNPYNSVQVIFDDFKNIQNINVYNYKYEPEKDEPEISKNKVNYVSLYDQFEKFPDSEGSNKTFLGVLKDQYARILKQYYSPFIDGENEIFEERASKLNAIYAIAKAVRSGELINPQALAILKENTGLGKNIGLNADSYNALYQHAKDYQVKTTFSLLAKDETNGFNFNDINDPKRNYNNYQKDALKTIKSIYTEVIEKHFDDKIIAKDLNKDQKDRLSLSFSGEGSIEKSQENPQETSLCKLANKIANNKEKVEANDYEVLSQKQQDQLKKPIDKFNTYSVNLKGDLIRKLEGQQERIHLEINAKRDDYNYSNLDSRLTGLEKMKKMLGYDPDNGNFNSNFMNELVNNKEKKLKEYGVHAHRGNGFLGWHHAVTTSFQNLSQALEKIESRYNKSDDRLKSSAAKEINKAIESEIYRLEPGYKKIAEIEKVISKLEHGGAISAEDKRGLYENRTSIWGESTSKTKKAVDHLIEEYSNESVQNKPLENAG